MFFTVLRETCRNHDSTVNLLLRDTKELWTKAQ